MMKSVAYTILFLAVLSGTATNVQNVLAESPANVTQADSVIQVWPEQPPTWTAPSESQRDTSTPESRQVGGKDVVRLGYVSTPEMHVYHAKNTEKSETVIVVCPGGGYSILAWDLEGTEIAEFLREIGVTTVVLKYRVPTREESQSWKAPVQDIQRTISMIRSGAVAGLEPKRVGVLGFSAGGNASARAATATERFYSPIDSNDSAGFSPDFAVLVYPAWLVEKENPTKLLDEIRVTESTPPIFFAHARDDRIDCLNSVTMFSELQKYKQNASLHVFAQGGHGFGARPVGNATDAWPELLENWMRDQEWIGK
ncbi:Acetylxylan esterase precursor [Planctomycetes bacterium CA13]|uniref:Acetylxylan esterase n=1 Tax=Novipirellula herctigrandis TaxID=2527986 RepID=A0A5C5YYA8_9BACT|nr:Acetylxylan esterase precursor [Planctomycetes bacterium CA13]